MYYSCRKAAFTVFTPFLVPFRWYLSSHSLIHSALSSGSSIRKSNLCLSSFQSTSSLPHLETHVSHKPLAITHTIARSHASHSQCTCSTILLFLLVFPFSLSHLLWPLLSVSYAPPPCSSAPSLFHLLVRTSSSQHPWPRSPGRHLEQQTI